MSRNQQFFAMRGGLDQETPAIAIPPGRCIAALNHEAEPLGYRRTDGYERFDGQGAPSDASYSTLTYSEGSAALAEGDFITGNNSGATARVLGSSVASGSYGGGDAAGTIAVHLIQGDFDQSELLLRGVTAIARLDTLPTEGDFRSSANDLLWYTEAVEYARTAIEAVPGSGAVRGVLWFGGKLHAWRDNAGATAGVVHHSSAAGWAATDLGYLVRFTSGGPYNFAVGDVITGDQTGATATVRYVALDSGDYADGDAAGYLVLDNLTGTLGDELLNVGVHLNVATITASPAPAAFAAGGRYEFDVFNFYATEGSERAYGANGVGPAFEFDGDNYVPFSTGMADDRPFLVKAHKNHLFLAFPYGSLQHSALGSPRDFSGILGAAELGLGHEITNIVPNTYSMLLVTTAQSLFALSGNDSSDWQLEPLSQEAGAKGFTAQRIGEVIYLDNRGVRSVGSTQTYGNFKLGTFTTLINKTLENKRRAGVEPVASCIVKTKSQYLLFFDDGSGISIFFGVKTPEAMPFQYPFTVSCVHVAEVDGVERVFIGADNGFVYELNKGTSFDGDVIEAFFQLPFNHHGDPRVVKRWHKLELEVRGAPGTEIGVIAQFDNGGEEQPFTLEDSLEVGGGGGLWGLATWGDFMWSAPLIGRADLYLDGAGINMSPIIVSRQSTVPSYTIAGATAVFSGRGRKR